MPRSVCTSKAAAILPARFGSSRFPGKPLERISGITLIQRSYENACRCASLEEVWVATDDQRIFDHVKGFGGNVCMTPADCPTGTDRLVEALKRERSLDPYDLIVNVQGDEPCIDPQSIDAVLLLLINDREAVMATPVVLLESEEEALNSSIVKCVIDQKQNALYFSRSLIPGNKDNRFKAAYPYYRHLGLYAFRRDFLLQYPSLPQTPLQIAEDLEQLKVLEYGYKIKVAIVPHLSIGVDNPEDIQKVERYLCQSKQNTSSLQAESVHRYAKV